MGEDRVSNELSTKLTAIHVSWRHNPFDSCILHPCNKQICTVLTKKKPEENIEFILKQPNQLCILCLLYIFFSLVWLQCLALFRDQALLFVESPQIDCTAHERGIFCLVLQPLELHVWIMYQRQWTEIIASCILPFLFAFFLFRRRNSISESASNQCVETWWEHHILMQPD